MAYKCYCPTLKDKAKCKVAFSGGRLGPCKFAPKSMSLEQLKVEGFTPLTDAELHGIEEILDAEVSESN